MGKVNRTPKTVTNTTIELFFSHTAWVETSNAKTIQSSEKVRRYGFQTFPIKPDCKQTATASKYPDITGGNHKEGGKLL